MKKRAKHSLSHYTLRTTNLGKLLPLTCVPVLPGDTFQHSTSALIRVSPLNTPVMHPVYARIHHWFVPNRILETAWENFITGGPDGMDNAVIPKIAMSTQKNSFYPAAFGTPPFANINVNALPCRAYNKIYNQRYRDQDLVTESFHENQTIQNVAWEKDYFTTARPWTSKGPTVSVPVGDTAPVRANTNATSTQLAIKDLANVDRTIDTSGANAALGGTAASHENLYADLASATGVDVNQFRLAFALQRYQEARARYGSRFTEYLRSLGIQPSDSRLQEPEFLGGGVQRLSFSEVLQTSPATEQGQPGVGDMYGHGIAAVRSNAYRKFFEEHGYVLTLLSVRPKATYLNGLHRELAKTTKEDYFQKELANIGQQEIWKTELYAEDAYNVFGWQDRYQEYRGHPSSVAGDFRDTLKSWHFGREVPSDVALNQSFVECVPTDDPFQVPSTTADTLWVMANHKIVARRLVPKRVNPRII